jgi:hypothetical protein
VSLHAAVLVFVPGCALAAWWQINRAESGNQLSYLYSVMWPVFGILALYFWWMLIHTDFDDVGLKGMRRQQAAEQQVAEQQASAERATEPSVTAGSPPAPAGARRDVPAAAEDPELAAYNARLAELAAKGPKTWRTPERVVVRRES